MDGRPRPDARDDAELVRAATAGDRGAFAASCRRASNLDSVI
jgi:hypothetical protein